MSISTRSPRPMAAPPASHAQSPGTTAAVLALLAVTFAACGPQPASSSNDASSSASGGRGDGGHAEIAGQTGMANGGANGAGGTTGTQITPDASITPDSAGGPDQHFGSDGGTGDSGTGNAGNAGSVGNAGGTDGHAASGGSPGSAGASGPGGVKGSGGGAGSPVGGAGPGGPGGTTFAPCPAGGTDCAIMPLGDSITEGTGSSGGGYRVELFRLAITNSKRVTFVGRNVNGPATVSGQPFPQHHEGYPHYTIDDEVAAGRMGISPLVDDGISMGKPNIILLMIGTNDVNNSIDLATAPMRLGALLDRMTADAPNALIVVAKLVPTASATTNLDVVTYNNAIPALLQSRTAAGKHILLVDMYAAITANPSYQTALMHDGLHPNDAGYVIMAQTWYSAIKGYLP